MIEKKENKEQVNWIGNIITSVFILILGGLFGMWVYQMIYGPEYITEINITYNDNSKKTLYYKDKLDLYLHEGDLGVSNQNIISSYVKSYTYHEKPNKNESK